MKKAFLNYVINSSNGIKKMIVEADSLDYIDSITSKYNNDFEFIKASNKKLKIIDFIKENGNKKGKLEIEYAIDINQKIDLPVFYNYPNRIVLDDDFMNNDVSEIEKARKLLFNSKNQLFARIALLDRSIMDTLSYKVSISYPEYLYAKSKKLNTSKIGDLYYISFIELINFRANNLKLGKLRNLYEEVLQIWKDKINSMSYDNKYFYSRQIALLIARYNTLKSKIMFVYNLFVSQKCYKIMRKNCIFRFKENYKAIKKIYKRQNKKIPEYST